MRHLARKGSITGDSKVPQLHIFHIFSLPLHTYIYIAVVVSFRVNISLSLIACLSHSLKCKMSKLNYNENECSKNSLAIHMCRLIYANILQAHSHHDFK